MAARLALAEASGQTTALPTRRAPHRSEVTTIAEQAESSAPPGSGRHREAEQNRTIWAVMLTLLVVLVALGILAQSSKPANTVNQGMRAVIVPTDDAARTVAVTPCGTGAPISSGGTASVSDVVGVTTVQLPQGSGVRVVVVPQCAAGSRATAGTSLLPSAAFVPRAGVKIPAPGTAASSSSSGGPMVGDVKAATSRLRVPVGSDVRTVVISPCTSKKTGPLDTLLGSAKGTPGIAVAPAC